MKQLPKASPNGKRQRHAHIWTKEAFEHYVEPRWTSSRLFDVEGFDRGEPVLDMCAGFGRIPEAAQAAGYHALAADIVDRGYPNCEIQDFLERNCMPASGVTNPPFNGAEAIARHAFEIGARRFSPTLPNSQIERGALVEGFAASEKSGC